MPVDEKGGTVPLHQRAEGLKAGVGQAFAVAQAQGRGVGDQDVKAAPAPEREPDRRRRGSHRFLSDVPGGNNPRAPEILHRREREFS